MSVEEHRTSDGGCISVRTDITDIIQRRASFQLLFESNPVPMFVCDNETLGSSLSIRLRRRITDTISILSHEVGVRPRP